MTLVKLNSLAHKVYNSYIYEYNWEPTKDPSDVHRQIFMFIKKFENYMFFEYGLKIKETERIIQTYKIWRCSIMDCFDYSFTVTEIINEERVVFLKLKWG